MRRTGNWGLCRSNSKSRLKTVRRHKERSLKARSRRTISEIFNQELRISQAGELNRWKSWQNNELNTFFNRFTLKPVCKTKESWIKQVVSKTQNTLHRRDRADRLLEKAKHLPCLQQEAAYLLLICCVECHLFYNHMLGKQHQNKGLKEAQQPDEKGWAVLGTTVEPLEMIVQRRIFCKTNITNNPDHPLSYICTLRLLRIHCNTEWYRKSFLPTAISNDSDKTRIRYYYVLFMDLKIDEGYFLFCFYVINDQGV